MRLLVVSQYFWPENFRINDLVAELVQRGHEVTVLTGLPNYPDGAVFEAYRQAPNAFAEYAGAKIERVPIISRGRSSLQLVANYLSFFVSASVVGAWRLRSCQFDAVFVCQLSPVTIALPGIMLARLKRLPMAMWILDLWPETLQAVGAIKSPRVLNALGWVIGKIYRQCSLILVQSHGFMAKVRARVEAQTQVRYWPNWAEDGFVHQTPPDFAPEVARAEGSFTVMFAGNVGEAQDFPAILEAAQFLRDVANVRWVIVGQGRMSGWVVAQVKARGLDECVFLPGSFPLERMPSFYRHASALLVSLKDEPIFSMTIPGKVQSYLASGLPLLGMLNGEGRQLILENQVGECVPAGDSRGLADAVLRMCSLSSQALGHLGANARALYERDFQRDKVIDHLEDALTELVSPVGNSREKLL